MSTIKGSRAENRALQWFLDRGATLITRNFRGQGGELDLILDFEGEVVIVEVRYRSQTGLGLAEETISKNKIQRIRKVSAQWLHLHPHFANRAIRFDVLAINKEKFRHYPDAF